MSTDGESVLVPEVDPEEARRRIENGAFLLDVREIDEWEAGHASMAYHVPLGELGARLEEIPADQEIVVCCRSGARSARAAAALLSVGRDASNLTGGMQAWELASFPVVDNAGQSGVVA